MTAAEEAGEKKDWGEMVEEADSRTPGYAVHMHEKLSSPSRKRYIFYLGLKFINLFKKNYAGLSFSIFFFIFIILAPKKALACTCTQMHIVISKH